MHFFVCMAAQAPHFPKQARAESLAFSEFQMMAGMAGVQILRVPSINLTSDLQRWRPEMPALTTVQSIPILVSPVQSIFKSDCGARCRPQELCDHHSQAAGTVSGGRANQGQGTEL